MRAGWLRERVVVQKKSVTRNTYGEEVIAWVEVDTYWAAVEPLRGREYMEGRQLDAAIDTRIRIRYDNIGIGPEMRVTYRNHVYNIIAVVHVLERQRELHLMCQETGVLASELTE